MGDRRRRRTAEPERLGHLAGAPDRCDRRPTRRDGRARGAPTTGQEHTGHHVYRWRSGPRGHLRGRPMSAVDVHAVVAGDPTNPAVVLSNSLGSTHRMWDAQVADLAEHFYVIRYDTRGHGESPAPAGPYSIDDLADDVIA